MSPIFTGLSSSQDFSGSHGPISRSPLLNGEQGTAQTIALMRKLVDAALANSQFLRLATDIVRSVPAYDDFGEAEALYNWVKRNIRFTKDPLTKETLFPPQELLKRRAGDCDDISMLLGALLLAVGYPARLVTVAANQSSPGEFSHVYVEAELPPGSGHWVPMDAARLESQFGVEPPHYFRKRAWSLTDDSYQDLQGNTRLRGLGAYGTVRRNREGEGLGDIDYGSIISQGITTLPAIMATAGGGSSTVMTPQGMVSTAPANPWGSFTTPYTPGYGIPGAGYGTTSQIGVNTSGSWLPILAIGALAFLLFRGRG